MSILVFLAKASALVLLALLIFLGIADALDRAFVAAPVERCIGAPLPACFLAVI